MFIVFPGGFNTLKKFKKVLMHSTMNTILQRENPPSPPPNYYLSFVSWHALEAQGGIMGKYSLESGEHSIPCTHNDQHLLYRTPAIVLTGRV